MTQLLQALRTRIAFWRLPKPVRVALRQRGEHRDARCVRAVFDHWRIDRADVADAVLFCDHKAWLDDFYRSEWPELFEGPTFLVDLDEVERVHDRFAAGEIDAETKDRLLDCAYEGEWI